MNTKSSDELLQTLIKLRSVFPDWRFGQLVANVATAAGATDSSAIWDIEDERLLAAARRLIENNEARLAARA